MNDIQNSLLDTMKQISDYSVKNDNAPLTIDCDVTSIVDSNNGIYEVQYLNSKFNVYSERGTNYIVGDKVYVLVPEGNFTKEKFIIGLYKGTHTKSEGKEEFGTVQLRSSYYYSDYSYYDDGRNYSPLHEPCYLDWHYKNGVVDFKMRGQMHFNAADGAITSFSPYYTKDIQNDDISYYSQFFYDEYNNRYFKQLGYMPWAPTSALLFASDDAPEGNHIYLSIDSKARITIWLDETYTYPSDYQWTSSGYRWYLMHGTYLAGSQKFKAPAGGNAYLWEIGEPGVIDND